MSHDRITQLRISGLRTIEDLTLDLRGLTVLIGDNGTGKSSIIEALELLRHASKSVFYVSDIVVRAHGGLQRLLRRGSADLRLGVTIEGGGPRLDYDFSIGNVGTLPAILTESLDVYADSEASEPLHALIRDGKKTLVFDIRQRKLVSGALQSEGGADQTSVNEDVLALTSFGVKAQPAFQRVIETLSQIEVHMPFETRPLWQQRELDIRVGPRWPATLEQTDSLARYGTNLPNAYYRVRELGDEAWERVRNRARLGLGDDFRGFRLPASGRGNIELEVLFGDAPDKPLPVEALSEGQLSYLALIALVELHAQRSVLAFDEPELHLHPALLARVVMMLEQVAERVPVVLSTHSDRLLDALSDPTASVVLCDLDENRATRLRRPNAQRLADWMQDYRGIGSIRADGYQSHVFESEQGT